MKRCLMIVSIVSVLAGSTPAFAEEELAPGFNACVENANSTAEQIECYTSAYTYWDKKLNTNYKKAQNNCSGSENPESCKKTLLTAQRSWLQYTQAMTNAIFEAGGGGSLARLQGDEFHATETKKQALLLQSLVEE